jgi:hypothetical protein
MSSFGYEVSSVFANWASLSQKKVATLRIKDKLESMCARKFQLKDSDMHWEVLSESFLDELQEFECIYLTDSAAATNLEETRQAIDAWKCRKWDVLFKYFGFHYAEMYRRRFSLDQDAYQTWNRVYIEFELSSIFL